MALIAEALFYGFAQENASGRLPCGQVVAGVIIKPKTKCQNGFNRTDLTPAEKRVRLLCFRSRMGREQQIQKDGQADFTVKVFFQG